MTVSQDEILGTDYVRDALKTKVNDDMTELFTIAAEVEAGRNGETSLLAKMQALNAAITALTAGGGILITTSDTTPGVGQNKILVGEGLEATVGNAGANETYTIDAADAVGLSFFNSIAF